ncbi:MAG: 4Fe-4S dicluster domain-containing protein [Thiohalomonadaceae bacterium]
MSNMNQAMVQKYRSDFLKEVEANVEEGHWVKMCMQCGVCSGSCPLGPYWEHPPQELFMMIRAGKREEVLSTESMWMCTSCYNCMARCPRGLPITHIMHGLASYAKRLGLSPKRQVTEQFGRCSGILLSRMGVLMSSRLASAYTSRMASRRASKMPWLAVNWVWR